ncbi:glycoside hydrolase family 6 protein [Nocardioides sp. YIM 152315]|uniref:glycoside hydrolase family 6 protein n=1 Tax=Nocardioides sp. YIM 152315 TaxID=3031760 RepID=UPI0023DA04B3|nr:glycoside hydrolase family 6 protein [Nocardioides sp. YIM 152315]MDF1602973.1 glycoside hydrolase family 6 protein [Nocardioides sp. YIM 152315]
MPLRRPSAALAALLAVPLGTLVACSDEGDPAPASAQEINPYAGRGGYADPDSHTAQAAAQATGSGDAQQERVLARLAETPQGIWLTPEQEPAGQVGPYVAEIVAAADDAGQVPTFVVYGIPDRDCSGGFSAGGLPADEYGPWVQEIADAADAGDHVVVVVEPDALPGALECGDREERVRLVADAVDDLAAAGATTYVDAGHANWVAPEDLAPLLEQVGVEDVRGFATNVSNFQSDEDEWAYAEELSGLLDDARYIIDSGRNGFGATDDWCNPPGRAFGTQPGAVTDHGSLDAYVWVKPPGESDGECGGGPPAGQFWPERALEIAAASGW